METHPSFHKVYNGGSEVACVMGLTSFTTAP